MCVNVSRTPNHSEGSLPVARFSDHFSDLAAGYARFRPGYPPSLFAWLASLAPSRRRAWDCATGSGQAATALAGHFDRVVATEASWSQLARAPRQARIAYVSSLAERSGLATDSVDLVTVAQALHWFDHKQFWAEVRRVLVAQGVVAVWGYGLLEIDPDPGEGLKTLLDRYYRDVVGRYWPPERRHIEQRYRSISLPFEEQPFEELTVPRILSEARWSREHLWGYLGTWSASKRYREAQGVDPREEIQQELEAAWPGGESRRVCWELFLRAARQAGSGPASVSTSSSESASASGSGRP